MRVLLVCSPAGLDEFFVESMALLQRTSEDSIPADEMRKAQKELRNKYGLTHINLLPEEML